MTREEVQKAALDATLKSKYSGILDLSPRVGKTKIAIDVLKTISSGLKEKIKPFSSRSLFV